MNERSDLEIIQGSDEWRMARAGSLGASKVSDATALLKTGPRKGLMSQAALDLMWDTAAERITRQPKTQVNALAWGNRQQPQAIGTYAFMTNLPVTAVGLIRHPTIEGTHCSPDALVGEEGGLETKCPTSGVHLRTLLADMVPEEHLPQIWWSLACTGRKWWDFVSFDPRFPADLQYFVKRVERDEAAIADLEARVKAFLAEVDAKVRALMERGT